MRPKKPTPKATDAPHNTSDTLLPQSIPRLEPPGLIRSAEPDSHLPDRQLATVSPPGNTSPTIQIRDLIHPVRERETGSSPSTTSTGSIRQYELPPQTRTRLPSVNTEGLRVHRGRIYAEVQYTATTTVMVAWDENIGTYRAMLPHEAHPSGPALYFDSDSNTWRIGEPQTGGLLIESVIPRQPERANDIPAELLPPQPAQPSRINPDTKLVYVDLQHYAWNKAAANHHGYTVMHRIRGRNSAVGPEFLHAFKDDNGSFVSVEPSAARIDQPADLLPAWTDHDIWDLYGLHGADINRFRTETERLGKRPPWVRIRAQRQQKTYLDEELRRWQNWGLERERSNSPLYSQSTTRCENAGESGPVTQRGDTPSPQMPSSHLQTLGTSETIGVPLPYGHQSYYIWDLDQTNFHGYVEMKRRPHLDDSHGPLAQVAFRNGPDLTIVQPTGYSVHKETALRPFWRDIDIWNLYRIEGEDIVRFRQEVAIHGKPPTWVSPRDYPSPREQLIDYLRLWTNPDSPLKSQEQILTRFQPYNLSESQLSRLCSEISPTGQFNNLISDDVPTWIKAHQAHTRVMERLEHFVPYLPEIRAEVIRLRNQGDGFSVMKASLTESFFDKLLQHCGFKRNKHNYLYREDIPAVFKADNRTPFEFARSGAMRLPKESVEGSTSRTAVSAMFSLKTAMDFANEVKNATGSFDTQLMNPLTGNELQQPRGSVSPPSAQRIMFCYLLDTRGVEVVPRQDNLVYNSTRIGRRPAGDTKVFPSMKMEGHVSMHPIGFPSRRIWMINSSMTRAATVDDIHTQARERATGSNHSHDSAIEARTRAGALNQDEYDALIDDVALAGKYVLELPKGKEIFSNNIILPPETITL